MLEFAMRELLCYNNSYYGRGIRRYTMDNEKTASSASRKKKKSNHKNATKILINVVLILLVVILVAGAVGLGTAFAWIKSAKP
jgi:cytoskeletal protein RodZ